MKLPARFALVAAVAACSGGPSVDTTDNDPITRGRSEVAARGCRSCHDPTSNGSFAGADVATDGSYAANLTPDHDTGIGGWSDVAIVRAIREGLDDQDMPLCTRMPHFPVTDEAGAAIVAFLRNLPPVHHEVPASVCPPVKGGSAPATAISDDESR